MKLSKRLGFVIDKVLLPSVVVSLVLLLASAVALLLGSRQAAEICLDTASLVTIFIQGPTLLASALQEFLEETGR